MQALEEKHHGCAQATLAVFLDQMNIQDELLMAASSCLVGGMDQAIRKTTEWIAEIIDRADKALSPKLK